VRKSKHVNLSLFVCRTLTKIQRTVLFFVCENIYECIDDSFPVGQCSRKFKVWTLRAIRDISIWFQWHFLAKVNTFELSPAESRFPFTKPFTRISVVEYLIFQCEPESMITCIVIANEEIRCDSSKFKVLYKQSSAQILASKTFREM